MKYVAEYVVSHRGNKHSGIVVLRSDSTPKVGDVLGCAACGAAYSYSDSQCEP
jgi:hypothetical protein